MHSKYFLNIRIVQAYIVNWLTTTQLCATQYITYISCYVNYASTSDGILPKQLSWLLWAKLWITTHINLVVGWKAFKGLRSRRGSHIINNSNIRCLHQLVNLHSEEWRQCSHVSETYFEYALCLLANGSNSEVAHVSANTVIFIVRWYKGFGKLHIFHNLLMFGSFSDHIERKATPKMHSIRGEH